MTQARKEHKESSWSYHVTGEHPQPALQCQREVSFPSTIYYRQVSCEDFGSVTIPSAQLELVVFQIT